MIVSRTESGRVLNEVITDQANGMNMSTAYEISRAYAILRRRLAPGSPTADGPATGAIALASAVIAWSSP